MYCHNSSSTSYRVRLRIFWTWQTYSHMDDEYNFFFLTPCKFFAVLHLSLADNKSPMLSRTLLSILDNFDSAMFVLWVVLILLLISSSSSLFSAFFGTVPSAPFAIGITVTFCIFSALWQGPCISFSPSFTFTLWSDRTKKIHQRMKLFSSR